MKPCMKERTPTMCLFIVIGAVLVHPLNYRSGKIIKKIKNMHERRFQGGNVF